MADNQTDVVNQISVNQISNQEQANNTINGTSQTVTPSQITAETSQTTAQTIQETTQTSQSSDSQITALAAGASSTLTLDQVASAATWVKNYVEANHKLPDYVTIGTTNVSMPTFLELLTTAVIQINNGVTTPLDLGSFGVAPVPKDTMQSGNMAKAEYLAIAANVKSFMDSKKVAPEFAYNTSLGLYFGYQNMVYTYAKIMDSYATNKVLPASVGLKAWSLVTNPPVSFTINQVANAATWVKNYVEANHKLPDYVTIGSTNVAMPSFLELLTTSVLQINGTGTTVDYIIFGTAPVPKDTMQSGNMAKAEYLAIAANVKSFMDSKKVAPEFAYNTSLGLYFGYQNMVYTYAKIMDSYAINKVLPASVGLKAWSLVTNPPVSLTIDQVASAATWVKNYVEANHKLPDYVTIGTTNVAMHSFLELLTTSVLQINGTGTTVDYLSFGTAPVPKDTIQSGNMGKDEYLAIAANVKSFMDSKLVAPEFAYNTSLGLYFGYQNMVYTYAKIMDSYAINKVLPASVGLKAWSLVTNPPVSLTIDQVASAATWVKNYVEANHKLPDYVTIGTTNVAMHSFLELLTTSVLQINGTGTTVDYLSFGTAPSPKDTIVGGNMVKDEYLAVAANVKSFMDSKLVAPEFAYNTSLGLYFGYQNMVYTYAKIMDSYATNKVLPASVGLKAWSLVINPTVSLTINQVASAATWVKNYVDTNHKLPDYVTIGTYNVSMPSFLEILTTTVLEIKNGQTTALYLMICASAPTPKDTITSGNIYTAEYLKIAADVKSFMDSNWVAPEYAYNTSLGYYLGYQNLVYMYSMIMDYYHSTGKIAEYAVMKPWLSISLGVPAELIAYTQPSTNCQSDNAAIIALANSLTAGSSTAYDKAVSIFNWVRDNISYSFYYNTQKGAVVTLNERSGNCCDTTHLLIALSRAVGIPAEYVHANCYFTASGNWYGHVFARLYIDGVWYNADAISSRNSLGVINNWDTTSWKLNGIYKTLPF